MKINRLILFISLSAFVSCTDFREEEMPVSFGVDETELAFPEYASTRSVTVSSGTKWDITSMPNWITLPSIYRNGHSPYEWIVDFNAAANDGYDREGTIRIKAGSDAADISVTQAGKKGKYIAVESVSLSPTELTLTEEEYTSLTYTITPSNASIKDVTWKSSSPSVATVSQSGRVDAISEGTALITLTTEDGKKTASCAVTVKAKVIPVTGVSLDKTTLSMNEGDVQVLTATVSPSNATDKSVTWSSSNTSVATVSSSGVVTAKIAGSATIMVTTNDGGKTSTCSVTVKSAWTVDGSENGHDYVDLGLPSGLKWATCNVGASSPEEYGNYYAWGETSTKSDYNWTNYKFRTSGDSNANVEFSKYNTHSGLGTVDNKIALDLSDDAARANWGGSWRMPTISEFQELIANCTYMWTTQNGVNGYKVTGKNGRSLFLPAAGQRGSTSQDIAGFYGGYWSSSLCTEGPTLAKDLYFRSSDFSMGDYYRCNGRSVRPVFADGPAVIPVTGVSLNTGTLSLTEGDTYTLTATVSPSNATDKSVTWSSSNTAVATVSSSGVVTAKAAGSATITVLTNDGGKTATCSVVVTAKVIAVTGVSLDKTSLTLTEGDTYALTATVTPSNASNKSVSWTSSSTSIATVSGSGVVTAKAAGSATITVTTADGGKTATCSVTVQAKTVAVTGISLDKTSLSMTVGDTQTLTATITPSNATDKSVTWSSNNTSVATVSSSGVVTAKSAGNAVITVTTNDGEKTATCAITVKASMPSVPEAIDLGLSVKWASFNIGATKPEEYGDYYAWGETRSKDNYSWGTYKWCTGPGYTLTKYCDNLRYGSNGFTDNKIVLDSEDDAAIVSLGGKWRMPTDAEWTEIRENCIWTWTTQNGVNGYLVSASNGNSIFLPAAGYRDDAYLDYVGSYGFYWSSSLYTGYPGNAWYVYFDSGDVSRYYNSRCSGFSVRPVSE